MQHNYELLTGIVKTRGHGRIAATRQGRRVHVLLAKVSSRDLVL